MTLGAVSRVVTARCMNKTRTHPVHIPISRQADAPPHPTHTYTPTDTHVHATLTFCSKPILAQELCAVLEHQRYTSLPHVLVLHLDQPGAKHALEPRVGIGLGIAWPRHSARPSVDTHARRRPRNATQHTPTLTKLPTPATTTSTSARTEKLSSDSGANPLPRHVPCTVAQLRIGPPQTLRTLARTPTAWHSALSVVQMSWSGRPTAPPMGTACRPLLSSCATTNRHALSKGEF
jgi:hypothetical protein